MTILYQWQTGGVNPCHACKRWNGQIFYTVASLPELPVHPHCECKIRAFDTYAEAAKAAAEKLEHVSVESHKEATRLKPYLFVPYLKNLYSDIHTAIYGFEEVYQTARIFLRNFDQMESAFTKGADKYFHTKANAQAAQLGRIGAQTAKFIGDVREFLDSYKNVYEYSMTVDASIQDSLGDLKANELGRKLGSQYPIGDMREFIKRDHLPGVDDEY